MYRKQLTQDGFGLRLARMKAGVYEGVEGSECLDKMEKARKRVIMARELMARMDEWLICEVKDYISAWASNWK